MVWIRFPNELRNCCQMLILITRRRNALAIVICFTHVTSSGGKIAIWFRRYKDCSLFIFCIFQAPRPLRYFFRANISIELQNNNNLATYQFCYTVISLFYFMRHRSYTKVRQSQVLVVHNYLVKLLSPTTILCDYSKLQNFLFPFDKIKFKKIEQYQTIFYSNKWFNNMTCTKLPKFFNQLFCGKYLELCKSAWREIGIGIEMENSFC